jgi:hypothetical protein
MDSRLTWEQPTSSSMPLLPLPVLNHCLVSRCSTLEVSALVAGHQFETCTFAFVIKR